MATTVKTAATLRAGDWIMVPTGNVIVDHLEAEFWKVRATKRTTTNGEPSVLVKADRNNGAEVTKISYAPETTVWTWDGEK